MNVCVCAATWRDSNYYLIQRNYYYYTRSWLLLFVWHNKQTAKNKQINKCGFNSIIVVARLASYNIVCYINKHFFFFSLYCFVLYVYLHIVLAFTHKYIYGIWSVWEIVYYDHHVTFITSYKAPDSIQLLLLYNLHFLCVVHIWHINFIRKNDALINCSLFPEKKNIYDMLQLFFFFILQTF